MARLAFKPDSSFFEKIVRGAVGTREVCADLATAGHRMVELERGSLDTKLWKDVKRKRVRIPDLLCLNCGRRVESRAKSKADLSMSHSQGDAERAWDFGMVDSDYVAFPICESNQKFFWSSGKLGKDASYWHERNWSKWTLAGTINYFLVSSFRSSPYTKVATKGVTEGSETVVTWPATFSTRYGTVESISLGELKGVPVKKVAIRRTSDGHLYPWAVPNDWPVFVQRGDQVRFNQVIASPVAPLNQAGLHCPGRLPEGHIQALLSSRERTQRFTGVKLARLLRQSEWKETVESLTHDTEEDIYIRLEGMSYLASVCSQSARSLFSSSLRSPDEQTQLEAVIAIGETATSEAVELLSELLDHADHPYFLRSAAAWCLGQIGGEQAVGKLISLFSDVDLQLREEALDRIVSLGGSTVPVLLDRIASESMDTASGCAEALRQQERLSDADIARLMDTVRQPERLSDWAVWLLGNLPREQVAPVIAELQTTAPQLHYAISLLWAFMESWIARRWELRPGTNNPALEDMDVV